MTTSKGKMPEFAAVPGFMIRTAGEPGTVRMTVIDGNVEWNLAETRVRPCKARP